MNPYYTIILIVIAGALALVASRARRALQPVAAAEAPKLNWLQAIEIALKTFFIPSHYDLEVGGYVHDTAMTQWISPGMCSYVTGTWADAVGAVTGTVVKEKTAADNTGVVYIPVSAAVPGNSVANKGSYFKSLEIFWATTTAALDAAGATVLVDRFVLPANGAAFPALVAHAFTYDAGNDTAAETDDLDEHHMTVTTPFWVDDDDLVQVRLTLDSAATSVIRFHGARVNYTLRI